MAKKDFSQINTSKAETGVNTGEVYAQAERGKNMYMQQGKASKQEQKERASKMKTQGRKGCKSVRINTAFTPENHDYVTIMSKITGKTMTGFINICIEEHRKNHPEQYQKAKEIIESLQD